jgi:hypothetical protein
MSERLPSIKDDEGKPRRALDALITALGFALLTVAIPICLLLKLTVWRNPPPENPPPHAGAS